MNYLENLAKHGLYRPAFEKDNCGFGLIAQMDGRESHELVDTAIRALGRMTHRGAIAADGKTGDGCGLLLKRPDAFLRSVADRGGFALARQFAVGQIFLSRDEARADAARARLTAELENEGLSVAGWRIVPTDQSACGDAASEFTSALSPNRRIESMRGDGDGLPRISSASERPAGAALALAAGIGQGQPLGLLFRRDTEKIHVRQAGAVRC